MKSPAAKALLILLVAAVSSSAAAAAEPTYRVIATLGDKGEAPALAMQIDAASRRLYAAREGGVDVYDLDAGKRVGGFALAGKPGGLELAPDLKRGFVSSPASGTITPFDLATLSPGPALRSGGREPRDLEYDAPTKRLYVSQAEGGLVQQIKAGVNRLVGNNPTAMAQRGRSVDCVYFVPNLRAWYVESTLYPFIGGDSVRCDRERDAVFQPSVNLILPYAYPAHHQVCPQPAVYNFSKTCLENTWKILLALESAYRAAFAKNLTLSRLGEAIVLPLCPDKGRLEYDPSLAVSSFLESDLAELDRLRDLFQKKEFTDELLSY